MTVKPPGSSKLVDGPIFITSVFVELMTELKHEANIRLILRKRSNVMEPRGVLVGGVAATKSQAKVTVIFPREGGRAVPTI